MAPRPASRPVVPLQEPVPPNMTPTLHFSRAEFAARVDRTRRAMEKRGIDALIVSDPSNMAWLTGRSEERRVGQELVIPFRSGGSASPNKKKKQYSKEM